MSPGQKMAQAPFSRLPPICRQEAEPRWKRATTETQPTAPSSTLAGCQRRRPCLSLPASPPRAHSQENTSPLSSALSSSSFTKPSHSRAQIPESNVGWTVSVSVSQRVQYVSDRARGRPVCIWVMLLTRHNIPLGLLFN